MKAGKRMRRGGGLLVGAALLAVLAVGATAPAQSVPGPVPEPVSPGVDGRVTLVPNPCPFYGCKGEPVGAYVAAWQDGRVVAWTKTRRGGRYALDLRPGTYTLAAYPWERRIFCEPKVVHVPWEDRIRVDIGCRKGPGSTRMPRSARG